MSLFTRRPFLRWLVPAVAAVVLAAGGSAVGILTANARGGLPERSPAQLLVDVQKARLDGLSGTIVQNAHLGLPSLPGVGGAGSSDMTSLVSGSHTLRLWYAGPNRVRLALLGSWASPTSCATAQTSGPGRAGTRARHTTRCRSRSRTTPGLLADSAPTTPQKAADAALSAIAPTTKVSTDGTTVVAGRNAYELVLQPKDAGSLVESVHIAIDGKTHIPTRVQIFARNSQDPSFEVGFTSFDPSTPASTAFSFNPPPGTKVTDGSTPKSHEALPSDEKGLRRPADQASSAAEPRIVGTGWTTVVVAKLPAGADLRSRSGEPDARRPAHGERHLGLGSPVEGHLVLGAAHRRRPGGRGLGRAEGAVRRH